jgi:predicted transcriptional regulator
MIDHDCKCGWSVLLCQKHGGNAPDPIGGLVGITGREYERLQKCEAEVASLRAECAEAWASQKRAVGELTVAMDERDAARAELAETLAAIKGDRDLFVEQERTIDRYRAALERIAALTEKHVTAHAIARAALAPHDKGTTDNG